MLKKLHKLNNLMAILVVVIMLVGAVLPSVIADNENLQYNGFTKGVSWQPSISMKKTTFVNFDGESLIDDYAYLAAVPTSVFYDRNG
ncbi:MAG: hypothetical protein KAR64_04635, partial [Thermoplasmatales archaeon]|nr:hypothetical protein [Thermoplasmatales archaeon]